MIRYYVQQYRGALSIASVLSAAAAAASIALLATLTSLAAQETFGGTAAILRALGLVVVMVCTHLISQTVSARLSADIIARLREELSQWFAALDYEKVFQAKHIVTSVLISDVMRLVMLLMLAPMVLFNAAMALFGLVYLATVSLKLLGVFLGIMGLAVTSAILLVRKSEVVYERLRKAEEELFRHFHAIADGKKELTLSEARAEHFMRTVVGGAIETSRRVAGDAHRWWAYGESRSMALSFIAVFSVIYAGRALLNESQATVMQFVVVALFIMGPLNALVRAGRDAAEGLASIRHIESIGVAPWRQTAPASPMRSVEHTNKEWRTITGHGLTYRYAGDDDGHGFTFGPTDLTIRRGELVFVIGGNGSGKSTLLLLLTGLLRPTGGRLEIDGQALEADGVAHYRRLFTGVFAEFHLFEHVIDRNGRLASDDSMNALLQTLDLDGKVTAAGGRLSTLQLSQGQRKRLALAQCYVDDSDVYVFDEWAADQDPEFRSYFYRELLAELRSRGKTIIVVSHDDRYFSLADRVIRMEHGRIQASA